MSYFVIDPVYWTTQTLLSLGHDVIHGLALRASATSSAYRLVVERCLLAVDQSKLYEKHGYSGAVHYAIRVLGLGDREAREMRRVASALESLPQLSRAAELGQVPWGKLREIVRKATVDTEAFWLKLASVKSDNEVQKLARATEYGKLPWQSAEEQSSPVTRLQLHLQPETGALFQRVTQSVSQQVGKPISVAEALEHLAVEYIAKRPLKTELVEAARKEARRGLAADQSRNSRLVEEARALAEECGWLDEVSPLAAALGTDNFAIADEEVRPGRIMGETGQGGTFPSERPGRVEGQPEQGESLASARPGRVEGQPEQGESLASERPGRVKREPEQGEPLASERPARVEGQTEQGGTLPSGGTARPPGVQVGPASWPDDTQTRPVELVQVTASRLTEILAQGGDPGLGFDWKNQRLCYNPRRRTATKGQRQELLRRDGHCCRTPGCPHHLWLELHHLVSYCKQGETVRANLVTLCCRCHRNLHNGLLKIEGDADGVLTFKDARGQDLERAHSLQVADWLNFWQGWSGGRDDFHRPRVPSAA